MRAPRVARYQEAHRKLGEIALLESLAGERHIEPDRVLHAAARGEMIDDVLHFLRIDLACRFEALRRNHDEDRTMIRRLREPVESVVDVFVHAVGA